MPVRYLLVVMTAMALLSAGAEAQTLEVGAGKPFANLSDAVKVATDGDTILISPGEYFDCAIVRPNGITIEGLGAAGSVSLTDRPCQGKALLVIAGNDVTVKNITLARARVPDGNGAGIRAEGTNLTVDGVRFVDNQQGILAGDRPGSTITVRNSEFIRNGVCNPGCSHGIYVNQIALLRVENSRFLETRQGHHIKSRADKTEVLNCSISDGDKGTASYLIDVPNGGTIVIRGNRMQKGPAAENRSTAISIGAEGVSRQSSGITIEGNTFRNDGDFDTLFVRNVTATPALLRDNKLSGRTLPLQGDGSVDGNAPALQPLGLKAAVKEYIKSALQLADETKYLVLVGVGLSLIGGFASFLGLLLLVFWPRPLRWMLLRRR